MLSKHEMGHDQLMFVTNQPGLQNMLSLNLDATPLDSLLTTNDVLNSALQRWQALVSLDIADVGSEGITILEHDIDHLVTIQHAPKAVSLSILLLISPKLSAEQYALGFREGPTSYCSTIRRVAASTMAF